jgi:hypothetical protein
MGQEKGENSAMPYLNTITLVAFVGSDPEQRQAKGNGSKFIVLSVASGRKGSSSVLHSGQEKHIPSPVH